MEKYLSWMNSTELNQAIKLPNILLNKTDMLFYAGHLQW